LAKRKKIPASLRTRILLANRHACCVCERGNVQIHHINGDDSDNREENLAVLCHPHHDKATAPPGLTAALTPPQVREYKQEWEKKCAEYVSRAARSRTAFFMVDYKNAERIRQLYSQLTSRERLRAYELLSHEFREEDALRKKQGFAISMEPNTGWSSALEHFLGELKTGSVHPALFRESTTHPLDAMYPIGFTDSVPTFFFYDLWCQVMIRAIMTARGTYSLEDLAQLEDPSSAKLQGQIVSFCGKLRGKVVLPNEWKKTPISRVLLTVRAGKDTWRSQLELKTHYVYSMTAAVSLGKGTENGLVVMRSVDSVREKGKTRRVVQFSCTPLIIGNGVLAIPEGPAEA
jgi:hypothetical protein